ncbi:MerR family transcriptional regulator [Enterococcus faecium]|uniref:MerR family transcriptional regulator n=1 Tax=Enterococcus faecium TaxID=1352 RepID=UPI00259BA7CC|nr:MerR family transcriptional regulator [Enterococcus faecium]WGG86712.1 MerR family transcriptional regulator [Enterococcus faecium]
MEYTIKKMSEISGVSPRTLRFYDEIGLLKPARINSSGYRIYGKKEVDRLQHILFYRTMAFKLDDIQEVLDNPSFDHQKALIKHQQMLLEKRAQIDTLLTTVQQTLDMYEGGRKMSDKEKFEGFKQQKLKENEESYGQEIRQKYGKKKVTASNEKWMNMDKETYEEMQTVEKQMLLDLTLYLKEPEDESLADRIFQAHKKWLSYSWPEYQPKAHKGLGMMYESDERFTAYYDERSGHGAAKALNEIIQKKA